MLLWLTVVRTLTPVLDTDSFACSVLPPFYSHTNSTITVDDLHNSWILRRCTDGIFSGEGYEVFQSVCSLRASSDDANYNTGDAPAKAQRYILLYLIVCNAVILATLLRSWKAIFPSI